MKRSRTSLLLAGAALVTALPASSQQTPESLLPPGFEEPAPPPQKRPQSELPPSKAPDFPAPTSPESMALPELDSITVGNVTDEELQALLGLAEQPRRDDVPDWARRSTAMVGPLGPDNTGMTPNAFGRSHGQFLTTLIERLDAPLPSRWTSILLRRALLTHVATPYGVAPVDWIAARAAALLRMGEADGARLLVQAVDVDQFTPRMFDVAVETALATADPAGLCPLIGPGRAVSNKPIWALAEAMCAALEGEASRASALIDQERRHGGAGNIDLLLAAKVVGAGENTRRAVTIEWDPVDSLDSWRFGLASATGLVVPERLMNAAGPRVWAWQARAPMVPIEQRLAASDIAASLGVFSNRALIEIYSLIGDMTDPAELNNSTAGWLRQAYAGRAPDARMAALRKLWETQTPLQRHARMILTASAAARVAPSSDLAADAPMLVEAMLTAGFDSQATRWSAVADDLGGSDGDRIWALLALASPHASVDIDTGRIDDFFDRDDSPGAVRSKLLIAALAGLGRIAEADAADIAGDVGVRFEQRNRWMAMLDSAAGRGQPATVALLAGIGMQTSDWRGVPPEHLYHILRALRRVGLDYEARMIAAEALSRL